MNILVIGPYAPYRDGIAAYTVQEATQLRRHGHHVEVLSPLPSAAHHHLLLPSLHSMVELVRRADGYDRVVVQFHPDFYVDPSWSRWRREAVWAAFAALARRTRVELRLHEIDYRSPAVGDVVRRLALRRVGEITVHTEAERARCLADLGLRPERVRVVDHGATFVPHTTASTAEARRRLGLPTEGPILVSIGFLQPHKGFDRAVRALARTGGPARLYVVGDVRTDDAGWVRHAEDLEDLIERTPGAELRRGYVSDEEFDLWIRAADRLVLPYREIWSSGVIERAHLLGTPTIVSGVGGLADQAGPDDVVVHDDDELACAVAEAVGALVVSPASSESVAPEGPLGRDELQRRIHAVSGAIGTRSDAGDVRRPGRRRRRATEALDGSPRPAPTSANPVNALLKRVVRRLTAWTVDPVADHVDRVVQAVQTDIEDVDRRLRVLEDDEDR